MFDRLTQNLTMSVENFLNRFGEVLEQVPTVGHLLGFRQCLVDGFNVGCVTVTADDLDAGVLLEPGAYGRYGAVREEVHGPATFEVHQDRAVAVAALQGEIVQPQHSHRLRVD